jgi:hypothetical protein
MIALLNAVVGAFPGTLIDNRFGTGTWLLTHVGQSRQSRPELTLSQLEVVDCWNGDPGDHRRGCRSGAAGLPACAHDWSLRDDCCHCLRDHIGSYRNAGRGSRSQRPQLLRLGILAVLDRDAVRYGGLRAGSAIASGQQNRYWLGW